MTVEAYPLHWPPNRPRTKHRYISRFKTSMSNARDLLKNEIRLSKCSGLIISSNVPLQRNGYPYANQRVVDPAVAVYFIRDGKQRCIPCDRWNTVYDNIYAVAKSLNALRSITRWVSESELSAVYDGFIQIPNLNDKPWYVVLELDEGEQFEVVESTYKYLRSLHHPDKNGEPEKFIQVQKAYNDYLKLLNKEEIKK